MTNSPPPAPPPPPPSPPSPASPPVVQASPAGVGAGRRHSLVPYLAWDGVLVVAAALVMVGFLGVRESFGGFWNGYSVQSAATLLGALALLVSIRLRVPNFAVAGIAVFSSSVAVRLVGEEAASLFIIVVAAIFGSLIGSVLAAVVVGLRVPAWGASLGLAGFLAFATLRIINVSEARILRGGSTLVDLGVPVYGFAAISSIAVAVALLRLNSGPGGVPDLSPDDGETARDGRTIGLQVGAIVCSSALAAIAGALLVIRVGAADGRIGAELVRPLAVFLLAGVSLRGVGSGVVGLVAATVIVETASSWLLFVDWTEPGDQAIVVAGLGAIGVVVGGILELISRRT